MMGDRDLTRTELLQLKDRLQLRIDDIDLLLELGAYKPEPAIEKHLSLRERTLIGGIDVEGF